MSLSAEMPSGTRKILTQLGVRRVGDVQEIREFLTEVASLGTPLLPEFTLHNQVHSDNIIHLIYQLKTEFALKLGAYEAFLLAASAYLHDLGMFFDGEAFEEDILPDLATILSFCPQGLCDTVENYRLFSLNTGAQVREMHSLLSAYWLYHQVTPIKGTTDEDTPYLIAICRGHGKANLRERGCWCYRTTSQDGEEIRVGLLASLLRLADAMDFYKNRAPARIFRQRAAAFLKNPISLEHWIKHFFVQDPRLAKVDEGGHRILRCTVYFSVPTRELNGVRYLDFFRPLFDRHIEKARKWDIDVGEYPPALTTTLGIDDIQLILQEREAPGYRALPPRIVEEVERSSCKDALDFVEILLKDVKNDEMAGVDEEIACEEAETLLPDLPSEPVLIAEDHSWYRKHLGSILSEAGYQCELAGTFEEAVRKLNDYSPFVLLLDLKLDGEFAKGWELAQRAADVGVQIIVVTGYPAIEAVNKAIREFDAVHFFDKARLSPKELIAQVSKVARRPRKERLSRAERLTLFEKLLGFFPEGHI